MPPPLSMPNGQSRPGGQKNPQARSLKSCQLGLVGMPYRGQGEVRWAEHSSLLTACPPNLNGLGGAVSSKKQNCSGSPYPFASILP